MTSAGFIGKLIVSLIAGLGAGLGTGFAGLSAAVVVNPMLITFLNMEAYSAVGIALASDVFASAISAKIYHKHGNIDIANGSYMLVSVLIFTFVGSWVASIVPHTTLSIVSIAFTFLIGLRFIIWPESTRMRFRVKEKMRKFWSVVCGVIIGFVCGFVGAGGGLAMLVALTVVLGYDLKTAVGTSVYIMTFTALTGALSHFALDGFPDLQVLGLCMGFTFIFARIGSAIANKVKERALCITTGTILIVLEIVVISVEYIAPLVN